MVLATANHAAPRAGRLGAGSRSPACGTNGQVGPCTRILSTAAMASLSSSSHSPWCSSTRRTHHPRASDRLRATPAATRVSSSWRSGIRSRVMTGTLRWVKVASTAPHPVAQETLRPKRASASWAMAIRASRVCSRNPSIWAMSSPGRSPSASFVITASRSSVPTTTISSRSTRTRMVWNQLSGMASLNHVAASAAVSIGGSATGSPCWIGRARAMPGGPAGKPGMNLSPDRVLAM